LMCCLHLCTSKHHYALGQMRDTKTIVLILKLPIWGHTTSMPY
jgi:hypothetical protein